VSLIITDLDLPARIVLLESVYTAMVKDSSAGSVDKSDLITIPDAVP
jgi:hypothetical protein